MSGADRHMSALGDLGIEVVDADVDCARCAAVCCRMTVLLMPDDRVAEWLVARDDHGLACMRRADDGWCVALDRESMRCAIYAHRPSICRDFTMGGGDCREARVAWQGAAAHDTAAFDDPLTR